MYKNPLQNEGYAKNFTFIDNFRLFYLTKLDLSMQQRNGKLYRQRNDYSDCYVKRKACFISQDK